MDISIGARQYVDRLRNILTSQFYLSDFEVKLAEQEVGGFTFINCNPSRKKKNADYLGERIFKHKVANALAEIILSNWEKELINKELKHHHHCFTEKERLAICDKAVAVLNNCGSSSTPARYLSSRKTRIVQKVLDYLEINNKLILEGFIRFRLKEYCLELQAAISVAVDEFLIEKEYHEFIRLLRYFIDVQEPKIHTLHVLVKPSGGFQLYDEEKNLITNNYLEGFAADLIDNEITYEDLLISALITIAPRFVVLHVAHKKESETVKTIRNVFGDRVSNCLGCLLCYPGSKS